MNTDRKPYHILWVYHATPGVNLSVTTQIEMARALRKLGWNVTLVLECDKDKMTTQDIDYTCISQPRVYLLGYLIFHLKLIAFVLKNRNTYDILYAHQMTILWLLPLRLLRITGNRKPLVVMDTRDLVQASTSPKVLLRKYFYRITHWLANRFADGQTAITRSMAKLVRIPDSKLWGIWPSGVDLQRFEELQGLRSWPDSDEPIRLIYIGVLLEERNLLPLCEALINANSSGANLTLTIVGNGPLQPKLLSESRTHSDQIQVLPPVTHEEIPELLSRMHVGVTALPEVDDMKYRVSSPIKLFEYMASGLPVLATRNPCHTEVAGNGSFAYWADTPSPEDLSKALLNIWENREQLHENSREAVAFSRLWSWSAAAEKCSKALMNGLDERKYRDQ